jgi:hypothetical protein
VFVRDPIDSLFVGPNDLSFIGHAYFGRNGVIVDDMMELLRYGTRAALRRDIAKTTGGYYELKRRK